MSLVGKDRRQPDMSGQSSVVGEGPGPMLERVHVLGQDVAHRRGADVGKRDPGARGLGLVGEGAVGEGRVRRSNDVRAMSVPTSDTPAVGVPLSASIALTLHLQSVLGEDEAAVQSSDVGGAESV